MAPVKQISDNGGDDVRDMAENVNTEVKTAAYCPWSNGLLEEHNQELPEIIMSRQVSGTLQWTGLSWQKTQCKMFLATILLS